MSQMFFLRSSVFTCTGGGDKSVVSHLEIVRLQLEDAEDPDDLSLWFLQTS